MISNQLVNDIQACKNCTTISCHRKFPPASHGNRSSKSLLVSEAPGKESLDKGQYWTGQGGSIFRACAANAGISMEDLFYLTDIVKCWPGPGIGSKTNRTPTSNEISNCSGFLSKEIDELQPELILSFGKRASELLLSGKVLIKKEHGKIHQHKNGISKVLLLLHPTNINYSMKVDDYKNQITELFKKIKEGKLDEISDIFNP